MIGSGSRATRRPRARTHPPRIKVSTAPNPIGRESSIHVRVEASAAPSAAGSEAEWRRTRSGMRMAGTAGRFAITSSAARRATRTSGRLSDAAVVGPRVPIRWGDAGGRVGSTFRPTWVLVARAGCITVVGTARASTGGAGAPETVAEPASATTTGVAATGSARSATGGVGASDAGGSGSGAAGLGAGCSAAGGGAVAAGEGVGAGGAAGAGGG